jgi:hypothetical protein
MTKLTASIRRAHEVGGSLPHVLAFPTLEVKVDV